MKRMTAVEKRLSVLVTLLNFSIECGDAGRAVKMMSVIESKFPNVQRPRKFDIVLNGKTIYRVRNYNEASDVESIRQPAPKRSRRAKGE